MFELANMDVAFLLFGMTKSTCCKYFFLQLRPTVPCLLLDLLCHPTWKLEDFQVFTVAIAQITVVCWVFTHSDKVFF
jgi:hypothetical protein